MKPSFGEQKEYLYREGSLTSMEKRSITPTPPLHHDEDLHKLRIGKFEFIPTYYHESNRLQVIIRRVTCYPVYQTLQNTAYLYVVACLLPDRKDFFESDLQQIHEDNLVDEMCEFEVLYNDIEDRMLLFEIHVCDRFSRHLIIGEFRYKLLIKHDIETKEPTEKLEATDCSKPDNEVCIMPAKSLGTLAKFLYWYLSLTPLLWNNVWVFELFDYVGSFKRLSWGRGHWSHICENLTEITQHKNRRTNIFRLPLSWTVIFQFKYTRIGRYTLPGGGTLLTLRFSDLLGSSLKGGNPIECSVNLERNHTRWHIASKP